MVGIVDDDPDITMLFEDILKSIQSISVFTFNDPILARSKLELGVTGTAVEYQDICGHCTSRLVEILERLRNMNESDPIEDVWNDVKKKISEQK